MGLSLRLRRLVLSAALASHAGIMSATAGETLCGIFVAPSGNDLPGAGLLPNDPCQTINFGIQRAVEEGLTCVFVQAGTYNEVVEMESGVNIDGGYDLVWARGAYTEREHAVFIVGQLHGPTNQYLTIYAASLFQPTVIENVTIFGPNVPGGAFGKGSYAVYVNVSDRLIIRDAFIDAGNGGSGVNGAAGMNAANLTATPSMHGNAGGNGQSGGTCNDTSFGPGGSAGTNASCVGTNGGVGGNGGRADTECNPPFSFDFDPTPGAGGQSGANAGGGFGVGGAGSGICGFGQNGASGRIFNGAAANAAPAGTGIVVGGFWTAPTGTSGSNGQAGGGGGGGGGAGGCNGAGTNSWGAGGGGGGAGGCPGFGGQPGGPGGGSFGVFAVNSTVQFDNVQIERGIGGTGGKGGNGGQGQAGGNGGAGGTMPTGQSGGDGGPGGHGGHGGGGAGGPGGISAGVYCAGAQFAGLATINVFGGAPGMGNTGGESAPFAPPSIDDGNDGPSGPNGTLASVTGCATTGAIVAPTCDLSPCVVLPCEGDCLGACCINGVAVTLLESECAAVGGVYLGADTTPRKAECPGVCLADIVSSDTILPPPDGIVDGADLAYLIGEWGPCR